MANRQEWFLFCLFVKASCNVAWYDVHCSVILLRSGMTLCFGFCVCIRFSDLDIASCPDSGCGIRNKIEEFLWGNYNMVMIARYVVLFSYCWNTNGDGWQFALDVLIQMLHLRIIYAWCRIEVLLPFSQPQGHENYRIRRVFLSFIFFPLIRGVTIWHMVFTI